jgi:hypothetical protein
MMIYDFSLGDSHCKKYKIINSVSFPIKEYVTTIADAPKEFESIVMSKEEVTNLRCKAMSIGAVIVTGLIITSMVLAKLLQ